MNLFYVKDFNIEIRHINKELVDKYNAINFSSPFEVSDIIYEILKYSVKLPGGFTVSDILSCDIMYIFFEIVKITKNENLYFSKKTNDEFIVIEFIDSNYKYVRLSDKIMSYYDTESLCFNINGFKMRLPKYKYDGILLGYIIDNDISILNYLLVIYFSHNLKSDVNIDILLRYNDILFDCADDETIDLISEFITDISQIAHMNITNGIDELSIIDTLDMKSILK